MCKNEEMPLISVILPTYNRMATLPRAISSVLNQTYQKLELIVVDDGSTDRTADYMEGLKDARVRYYRNTINLGPSASRNLGAGLARGQYIAFQDSDDEFMPDKLYKQMDLLRSYPGGEAYMAYHELQRYVDGSPDMILPPRSVPCEKKSGKLFTYLLLNPLISTQTMLIDKEAFQQTGGFNEKINSLVDYEFSIRFAQKYPILFLPEILVKVYDMPGSVCKRWEQKIYTQAGIIRDMYQELVKYGLLEKKIFLVKQEADAYRCRKHFYRELEEVCTSMPQDESAYIKRVLGTCQMSDRHNEDIQESRLKLSALEGLNVMRESVLKLYQYVMMNDNMDSLNASGIESSVRDIERCLADDLELFCLPNKLIKTVRQMKPVQHKDKQGLLSLLASVYQAIEGILAAAEEKASICNVCGNKVFFKPRSGYYEKMQKQFGFPYWNAGYWMLDKVNYQCPECGAFDRDRLIIAFLEELKPEGDEKLSLLQFAPTAPVEQWARTKTYIKYESTDIAMGNVTFHSDIQDMGTVEDERYDIIVCSHVLEHVQDDTKALKELYRILKPSGAAIVLVPLLIGLRETDEEWGCSEAENWRRFGQGDHARLYAKQDFEKRAQNAGFFLNKLDSGWFGEEFYKKHGFGDRAELIVLTKTDVLKDSQNQEMTYDNQKLLELEDENELLHKMMFGMADSFKKELEKIRTQTRVLTARVNNVGYEVCDKRFQDKLFYPTIMTVDQTINEIVSNNRSIARFGDGEFAIISGYTRWRFQRMDKRLSERLLEVLRAEDEQVLIGLIDFYGDLSSWRESGADGARAYLSREVREAHYKLLDKKKRYANTEISRIKEMDDIQKRKRIWEGRDCVFIEGYQTRMGIGNDLFDNVASVKRILCPAESAFDKYEQIYEAAVQIPKECLILLALGPTATVLAYDLAKAGYQALDIGHMDLSCDWVKRGKMQGDKIKIPYKYNNEVEEGYLVEEIQDDVYQSQIIIDLH